MVNSRLGGHSSYFPIAIISTGAAVLIIALTIGHIQVLCLFVVVIVI